MRNNLFHGNKMLGQVTAREERLIAEALSLIELILEARPDIRDAFYE